MIDAIEGPEDAKPQEAPKKAAITICICRNGQVILRQGEKEPPQKILLPMNLQGDGRLFVKNGELVTPSVVFHFAHRITLDVSGIDVSLYSEAAMDEFDPTDMVPIAIRSLEKEFEELNNPKE